VATTAFPESDAPAPAAGRPPARADGTARGLLREAGELTTFAAQAARALPSSMAYFSEALRQASMMISGTIVLLFFMAMFQGAAIADAGYFVLRAIGAADFFGLLSGWGVPRFTAQLMFGYVFAAKVCCGMTAQLGAMKIQQEVDALESTGVSSMSYLVGTRLLGVLLFLPVAFVVTYVGDTFGAYFITVVLAQGITSTTFFSVHWSVESVNDLIFMAGCMGVIAGFGACVACFYGLRTSGGPAAVGNSVARSLVVNLVVIHIVGAAGAVLVYGIDQHLPIGG
jgi:phospholipid/cholesterol/gamma-HCH transport system permease protein